MGTDSVVQLSRLFDSIFDEQTGSLDFVEGIYIFCLTWSVGSVVDREPLQTDANTQDFCSFFPRRALAEGGAESHQQSS